jgi:SAM-dependent methyltransferase
MSYYEELTEDQFIRLLYSILLRREPDEEGFRYYAELLKKQTVSREEITRNFIRSDEFKHVWTLEVWEDIHKLRKRLVRQLPPADYIVDLGGAARDRIEGALYSMGYPHRAKRLVIVDLPPEERYYLALDSTEQKLHETPYGIVEYHHSNMVDLSYFPNESVDLVWAGQSIEHVTSEEADQVFGEVKRVLKEDGHFCLDTPNARLTRLQSPDHFIDGDHKIEYEVEELREKIKGVGFTIVEEKGLFPMPESVAEGVFDESELTMNAEITSEIENAYIMFFKCSKA